MKTPAHHPDAAFLLDYASGSQPKAVSIAVATHLTLCPACRREVARLEALGGASLEGLDDAPLAPGALEATLKRIGTSSPDVPVLPAAPAANENLFPRPLLRLINAPQSSLSWRKLGGFAVHRIGAAREPYSCYLIRGEGGTQLARHTHEGEEITLVLEGGLTDGDMHMERGDFTLADENLRHAPLADPEGCLLFAVVRGSLRFDGTVAGLVGRWFGV